ncbi:Conserved oligomeric Golgi complex subunit 8 [Grifola frondosa]|uniref:Conserved oligomeric Golgi complex subunit 8 n=1 Tax=Grifola frondosa TaxID=5627 RepID=A0A1C7LV56_GRIFR|nr:Conserved oligomeric Golgi complex subunit 8 [Grifola frondosa]
MSVLDEIPTLTTILASDNTLSPSVFASEDVSAYIAHLTSLPLSELESEPTVLASSSAQLTNALTTLCYTSYPTFLSLHSTTATLTSSLSSLSSSLDSLMESLPALEMSTRKFAQETRDIQKDRRKASLVLEHHDKLYDVLSLPLLLDSCVRNHNYTDALLLSNHAASLARRFPSNPVIQSVKAECDARVQSMLAQLLHVLSEQAKLPALFRAVGFLRKMDVLTEDELALAFLTGRATYLDGALRTVEGEKKGLDVDGSVEREREAQARFLKRYIDAWREGVYDVVTQYAAIFLDRPAPGCMPSQLHILLTAFTTLRVHTLLTLLRETLPLVADPALLNSLLTQLTYCANSFARVGMDFKALLSPVFVDAVQIGISKELDAATDSWCAVLTSSRDKSRSRGSISARAKPSQFLLAPSAATSPPVPSSAQLVALVSAPAHVPPPVLASYPPLAIYTNAVLSTFNSLRMLAPVELLPTLLTTLDASIARGAGALLAFARTREWARNAGEEETRKEEEAVRAAVAVFVQVFVPFVRRALVEGVYGAQMEEAGATSGVEVSELEEWLDLK